MNVDIQNIDSKKQPFWRSIYEFIDDSFFEETKLFPTKVLNQCRNNANEPQNIPSEVKEAFKKCLWSKDCMHKWLLPAEEGQMIKRKNKRQII